MKPCAIDILDHLPIDHCRTAAGIYYAGLRAKLAPVFGPSETALGVLSKGIVPSRCLAAFAGEQLVGVAGRHDRNGGFLEPSGLMMMRHYGTIMGFSRSLLLMMLDHNPPPGDLYLDGLAVAEPFRGRGIGTALVAAFENHARENGFETVSLEVIDINVRARRLYERLGYACVATHTMGPFNRLFGFSTTRRMMKTL